MLEAGGLRARLVAAVGALLVLPLAAGSPARAAAAVVDDPAFVRGDQWGLTGAPASINAPAAWCASSGAGILIADVDTGADFAHPDLAGRLIAGQRFTNGDGSPSPGGVGDDNGHGTMTTGLMVADTGNGIGIAAVAPGARALIVKALDSSGGGATVDVAAGIRYATDYIGPGGQRVSVINLSVGGDTPALLAALLGGTEVQDAIRYAAAHGVAVAAAAGNGGHGLLSILSPNDYAQLTSLALVVGATGRNGALAFYSTVGNLYAPGGDSVGGEDAQHEIISTTLGGGYGIAQGTSFAAPHAAGVLALLMARGLNAAQARDRILATAALRNGLPELDAGAALGSSGSCAPSVTLPQTSATSTRHGHRLSLRGSASGIPSRHR